MLLCVALVAAMGAAAYAIDPPPTPSVEDTLKPPINPEAPSAEDAVYDGQQAGQNLQDADDAAAFASVVSEVRAAVEAYESVRNNPNNSIAVVEAAYNTMDAKLQTIQAQAVADGLALTSSITSYPTATLQELTTATNYSGTPGGTVPAQTNVMQDAAGNYIDTGRELGGVRSAALRAEAGHRVAAAQYVLAQAYDMSGGTQMDWNTYIIGATAVEQARQTKDAKAAADAAKAGAATAASTAKALINQSMAIAQDAAAEAVANAQTTAYNNLAATYATAVADFWAGVSAEIATW